MLLFLPVARLTAARLCLPVARPPSLDHVMVWSVFYTPTVSLRQLHIMHVVQTQSSAMVWWSGLHTCVLYSTSFTRLPSPHLWRSISPCIAQLIVAAPLMVTLSGSGGAQVAGEDYTLTCQFTGGEAVTLAVYQWLKDGLSLANETSDTLSFSPLRETDSGGYTCEVTTGSLTATSPSVTITVVGKSRQ